MTFPLPIYVFRWSYIDELAAWRSRWFIGHETESSAMDTAWKLR